MAVLIPEPSINDPTIEDWKKLLYRTAFQAGGFMSFSLENMDSTGVPRVIQGSRFQINHALFLVETTEDISGNLVPNQVNYVYAVPNGEKATFVYSTTTPVFDPVKGGWYKEQTDRAVAKMIYGVDNTFWNKIILDTEGSIRNFNPNSDTLPNFGGIKIIEADVDELKIDVLKPGAYYLEVMGGKGGKGGNGGNGGGEYNPGADGAGGAEGDFKVVAFLLTQTSVVTLYRGANGANGTNGANGANSAGYTGSGGGGGAGKNGKASYIHIENLGFLYVLGGKGGAGGKGGNGRSFNTTAGGAGGESPQKDKLTTWNALRDEITSNNGLNGDNGIDASGAKGGAGGKGATTFLNTSSGYARIYKL
jgi:hypothetical protein